MVKETIRFPDELVEVVTDIVEEENLDSKSVLYRFGAELLVYLIHDDYEPSFEFGDLKEELEIETRMAEELRYDLDTSKGQDFLSDLITVRKLSLRGEFSAAEKMVDELYPPHSVEAIILEEMMNEKRGRTPQKQHQTSTQSVGQEQGTTTDNIITEAEENPSNQAEADGGQERSGADETPVQH